MSISFGPGTKGQSDERIFEEGEVVIYKNEEVTIKTKQLFMENGGIYYRYRIEKYNGENEPPKEENITELNGISSKSFTKISSTLDRTNSNGSTSTDDSRGNMSFGGAMTKKRKTKNRKTKNRKTKNRKSKNRKSKNRKSKNRKSKNRKSKNRKTKLPISQ